MGTQRYGVQVSRQPLHSPAKVTLQNRQGGNGKQSMQTNLIQTLRIRSNQQPGNQHRVTMTALRHTWNTTAPPGILGVAKNHVVARHLFLGNYFLTGFLRIDRTSIDHNRGFSSCHSDHKRGFCPRRSDHIQGFAFHTLLHHGDHSQDNVHADHNLDRSPFGTLG